jgi:hypothetical protein
VPAENAFNAAREAAKAGDSGAVLKHAKTVGDLTRLGAAQAQYPSTEVAAKPVAKPKAKPKARSKRATAKPVAKAPVRKPQAGGATQAVQPSAKAAPPAPASDKPAAVGNPIKPRKLCWQGDRLEECP